MHTESNSTVNTGEVVNFTLDQNNYSKNQEVNISIWATSTLYTTANQTTDISVNNTLQTETSGTN